MSKPRPLAGLKVLEMGALIAGPFCAKVLAEFGAEVIKLEPPGTGDPLRKWRYVKDGTSVWWHVQSRGKKSVALDLRKPEGQAIARKLALAADIVVENFRPGTMERLGLGYEALAPYNPRLIYCSEKGFLSGPYEQRTALDEVAQMMGGLAYMTGPPGRPLRAGSSVIDVTGGMFGVIGILAALEERHRTGRGQKVASSLFETTVYLVGQHMAQQAVTGQAAKPMPVRISAWAIYDVFETQDSEQVFVGIVSDSLWEKFCAAFGLRELGADPQYKTNSQRVLAREALLPQVRAVFKAYAKDDLIARLERTGLPFAPIGKPEELFDDPHLLASGGLGDVTLADGRKTRLPLLPIELDGARPTQGGTLPAVGQHTRDVLASIGVDDAEIDRLSAGGVIQ